MTRALLRLTGLCLALLLAVSQASGAQDSGLQQAVRLVSEGRLAQALEAARGESDALARSQAELHVLHHGGLLEEALEAGLGGLEGAPEDPWLLERTAYIALSLGTGELAVDLCEDLRRAQPQEWERHAWMMEEALSLRSQREGERKALGRARTLVGAGLLFSALLLLFGARGARS